jgi:hypothetical protein
MRNDGWICCNLSFARLEIEPCQVSDAYVMTGRMACLYIVTRLEHDIPHVALEHRMRLLRIFSMDGGVEFHYFFSAVADTWYRTLIPHMSLDAVCSIDLCMGGFSLFSHPQFLSYQIASVFSLLFKICVFRI